MVPHFDFNQLSEEEKKPEKGSIFNLARTVFEWNVQHSVCAVWRVWSLWSTECGHCEDCVECGECGEVRRLEY